MAVRLFVTCWIVYGLHFATNVVREHYLAFSIGDQLSFRVDEYAGLHPDIFQKEGYGWHIGNNPGASMIGAIPYAMARPVIDDIVEVFEESRADREGGGPPAYETPWPLAREFYAKAWERGYDVKFALGAFVTQAFAMAPLSALGVVVVFLVLAEVAGSRRMALWLAMLYAFATPVFFRTGFLNQNMLVGHAAFFGFVALWNPNGLLRWSEKTRYAIAGLMGGLCVLLDYSGAVALGALFLYGAVRLWRDAGSRDRLFRRSTGFALAAAVPVLVLWFYQWKSFGNPFLPGQHWMPPVEWIEEGYQGFELPQPELFATLGFDHRYGLFVSAPLFLLALFYPLGRRRLAFRLPRREAWFVFAVLFGFWIFFSGVNYTRLQFNTGVRYMAPVFPFVFLPTAAVLASLPRLWRYLAALVGVVVSWPLAMYRIVEHPLGILNPVARTLTEGFQLPVLRTLSRMSGQYGGYGTDGVSAIPLMVLAGGLLYAVWLVRGSDAQRADGPEQSEGRQRRIA